jgi:hypothetical protein
MGTGPLMKMESAGRRGKEIVPTRSLKEIMSPRELGRITQMSDFLKLFSGGLPRPRGVNRMKARFDGYDTNHLVDAEAVGRWPTRRA